MIAFCIGMNLLILLNVKIVEHLGDKQKKMAKNI